MKECNCTNVDMFGMCHYNNVLSSFSSVLNKVSTKLKTVVLPLKLMVLSKVLHSLKSIEADTSSGGQRKMLLQFEFVNWSAVELLKVK